MLLPPLLLQEPPGTVLSPEHPSPAFGQVLPFLGRPPFSSSPDSGFPAQP